MGIIHAHEEHWIGALALAGLIAVPALPAAAQEAAKKQNDVANFLLDNGMEVVVIPDHRAPIVTHMVWYKIGSADEPAGKSGIAHFFEHLMFKGTSNHKAGEFGARIAEIGGSENAFTSYDYTAYFQQVSPDALETMMSYEADRMRNLILTDAVIGPERDVILEERNTRVENDPGALLEEESQATLYQNHPYRIPVIGWKHEIEKLNRTDAVAFYDRYYAPNNAVLVVAGDVNEETVRQLAEKTYGKVPRGPDLPPRVRPQEPEQNASRTVTLRDERVSVPSFSKSWVVPSYNSAEPGEAEALDLLSEILGGGTRSRIYQKLVVQDGVASGAGAYYQGSSFDPTVIHRLRRAERRGWAGSRGNGRRHRDRQDRQGRHQRQRAGKGEEPLSAQPDFCARQPVWHGEPLWRRPGDRQYGEGHCRMAEPHPRGDHGKQVQAVAAKYLRPNTAVASYLLPKPAEAQN